MDWEARSNPALVSAIVATFRDLTEDSARALSKFDCKEWKRTELWLDSSGLALYFIDRLNAAGAADAIPAPVRHALEEKLANNKERATEMLKEFVALNRMFEDAGILYANLKGLTVTPDSCPKVWLRHQSDYDFLVDPADRARARALLERRGYRLTGSTSRTLEFKSGSPQQVSVTGRYKSPLANVVELHSAIESTRLGEHDSRRDERLNRLIRWDCDGGSFQALSPADQLIGQALHLLGHLRDEYTRLSWLLEFRHHVKKRRADGSFWTEVATLALSHPDGSTALGLCTVLANQFFATCPCPALDAWTADVLPASIRLWAERYGRRSVLSDLPGTKLYLFLDMAIATARPLNSPPSRSHRLIPVSLPARILRPPEKDSFGLRINRELVQLQYILYRFRFHARQALTYAIESWRWKRILKANPNPNTYAHAAGA